MGGTTLNPPASVEAPEPGYGAVLTLQGCLPLRERWPWRLTQWACSTGCGCSRPLRRLEQADAAFAVERRRLEEEWGFQ